MKPTHQDLHHWGVAELASRLAAGPGFQRRGHRHLLDRARRHSDLGSSPALFTDEAALAQAQAADACPQAGERTLAGVPTPTKTFWSPATCHHGGLPKC